MTGWIVAAALYVIGVSWQYIDLRDDPVAGRLYRRHSLFFSALFWPLCALVDVVVFRQKIRP